MSATHVLKVRNRSVARVTAVVEGSGTDAALVGESPIVIEVGANFDMTHPYGNNKLTDESNSVSDVGRCTAADNRHESKISGESVI